MLGSVSLSVARSAFTWLNVPVMVRLVVPEPLMLPPPPSADVVADSLPWPSLSVTVKLSSLVLPLSDRLTPVIFVA